ncbi:MAG TPA: ABC transporter ATP-binding protein [Casimicrobiaceae bacterium]|nr:ABC transporter ATP-binding protein [Casimicrobiaceae bacterium]
MTTTALLSARSLAMRIGGRSLFSNLSFDVEAGQCWAIVGPNGAGKTSMLNALAGFVEADAGEVHYQGRDVRSLSLRERALIRAVLPQDSYDAFPATVLETVLVGRHPYLSRFAWERNGDISLARQALSRFGVARLEQRDVRSLSGGERRRAALATLLVQDTPLLLLDEPSSHLDVGQQATALDVLVGIIKAHSRSLVMVLHDLHLATRYCDHAIIVGNGAARAGNASALLTRDALSTLFGRSLAELEHDGLRAFVPR